MLAKKTRCHSFAVQRYADAMNGHRPRLRHSRERMSSPRAAPRLRTGDGNPVPSWNHGGHGGHGAWRAQDGSDFKFRPHAGGLPSAIMSSRTPLRDRNHRRPRPGSSLPLAVLRPPVSVLTPGPRSSIIHSVFGGPTSAPRRSRSNR
jgi:hypothetical protein